MKSNLKQRQSKIKGTVEQAEINKQLSIRVTPKKSVLKDKCTK